MLNYFQEFILSQWLILIAHVIVFLMITRWAIVALKEYAGYGLGWFLALFFILVYSSVGGIDTTQTVANPYLNGFQVLIATIFGLIIGSVIIVGLRFGMQHARAISLQVALYTALVLILMFLVFVEGPISQRMIGIFGMAIGIATLFAMVLFPSPEREEEINLRSGGTQRNVPVNPGQDGGGNPRAGTGSGSRLEEIRTRMKNRQGR